MPTLLQIFPHAGCQFGFYELFRIIWNLWHGSTNVLSPVVPISESLVCGASAGICSKAVVYPLDLVKKRLQIQGFEIARARFGVVRQYNSLHHALQLILKEEGILGLYKGFMPSVLKAGMAVGVTFASYELCCSFIRSYRTWTPYIV
ncbi:mitochondrial thiamine pyrophosphate carrier-like [Corticium candelabrum]|uniref:mitochondrial thiamine pyrophosphate carrier-like n=1 Tax=Corticium candelabrum TaxID=121492 RepID=UPI002E25FBEC|nr:mitochondrial thiamine pyrophosphate carrier-like [Corticium candelabrum]